MRVVVYGSEAVIRRISPLLDIGRVMMISITERIDSPKQITTLDNINDIDMVVVDSTETGAEQICNYFMRLRNIPVALLVNSNSADWVKLCSQGAFAYIPHAAGELEFAARIKNIITRIGGEKR